MEVWVPWTIVGEKYACLSLPPFAWLQYCATRSERLIASQMSAVLVPCASIAFCAHFMCLVHSALRRVVLCRARGKDLGDFVGQPEEGDLEGNQLGRRPLARAQRDAAREVHLLFCAHLHGREASRGGARSRKTVTRLQSQGATSRGSGCRSLIRPCGRQHGGFASSACRCSGEGESSASKRREQRKVRTQKAVAPEEGVRWCAWASTHGCRPERRSTLGRGERGRRKADRDSRDRLRRAAPRSEGRRAGRRLRGTERGGRGVVAGRRREADATRAQGALAGRRREGHSRHVFLVKRSIPYQRERDKQMFELAPTTVRAMLLAWPCCM